MLFGRFLFQQFSFSTFSRQAIGLIEYLIDIPRIEMTLMTRTNREKAQVVASRKKQHIVVSVSDFALRGNCREEKEPCSGFEPGNTALKSERSTARLSEQWSPVIHIYKVIASTKLDMLVLGYIGVDFWSFCCTEENKNKPRPLFPTTVLIFFGHPSNNRQSHQLLLVVVNNRQRGL